MFGEIGLRYSGQSLEDIADAAVFLPEYLQDLQAGFVGKGEQYFVLLLQVNFFVGLLRAPGGHTVNMTVKACITEISTYNFCGIYVVDTRRYLSYYRLVRKKLLLTVFGASVLPCAQSSVVLVICQYTNAEQTLLTHFIEHVLMTNLLGFFEQTPFLLRDILVKQVETRGFGERMAYASVEQTLDAFFGHPHESPKRFSELRHNEKRPVRGRGVRTEKAWSWSRRQARTMTMRGRMARAAVIVSLP
jgi:hypothetical protein